MKPLVNIYISQSQKTASGQLELIIRREVRKKKKEISVIFHIMYQLVEALKYWQLSGYNSYEYESCYLVGKGKHLVRSEGFYFIPESVFSYHYD